MTLIIELYFRTLLNFSNSNLLLYIQHLASNAITRYRPLPTPAQYAASQDLITRATAFIRRELRVWVSLDVEVRHSDSSRDNYINIGGRCLSHKFVGHMNGIVVSDNIHVISYGSY